jgi:protocatechuate 3,4-dioxygenase beta subunit
MKLLTRRALLRNGLGLGLGGLLVACGGSSRAPTVAVHDADDHVDPPETCGDVTAANIEGPYFKAGAPDKAVLADDREPGQRLSLSGLVTSTSCAALADVVLEIWHADAAGGYDNDGYHLRGKLRTSTDGRYSVETIIPGRYLNGSRYRPAHVHVKLHAPGHRELTTQLYFEGDPYNDGDPFIDSSLIMPLDTSGGLTRCRFDFVLGPA